MRSNFSRFWSHPMIQQNKKTQRHISKCEKKHTWQSILCHKCWEAALGKGDRHLVVKEICFNRWNADRVGPQPFSPCWINWLWGCNVHWSPCIAYTHPSLMLPRLVIGDIGPLMSKFPSNTWYLEEVSADGGTNSEFLPLWTALLFEYTSERQTQILRYHCDV